MTVADMSVVIPTHRRAALLTKAIASVAAQRAAPGELLVVDDAADPVTRTAVAAAAATTPFPVCYVENPDGGVCRSRNLGARTATGSWVAFLDDDDAWHPDFLLKVRAAMARDGVPLAMSGIARYEMGRPPVPRVQLSGLRPDTVLRQPGSMTGSNFAVERETFLRVGGFDPAMTVFNDWDLFVRLIDVGTPYVVVPEQLAEWREHGGERIATFSVRRADGLERFLRRYGARLSPELVRDYHTTALGIRRGHAFGWRWLVLTLQLALAHGPERGMRRVAERLRPI